MRPMSAPKQRMYLPASPTTSQWHCEGSVRTTYLTCLLGTKLMFESRIEALEAKVNQLLEPGGSAAAQPASPEPSERSNTLLGAGTATLNGIGSPASSRSETRSTAGDCDPADNPSDAPHKSIKDVIDAGLLTMMTAGSMLDRYKSDMTPYFPFVVIPPRTTAKQLHQEKPFLFLTIMAAASYDNMPLQRMLGKVVKRAVSRRMIHGEDSSFPLLQGLMVHLAW
ncbi:MAG: hypothetical protein M1812_002039 [Candelaria pacifica]|nr:MAG: hypothetical protein M1812_002039 [Candelaria pacifica]